MDWVIELLKMVACVGAAFLVLAWIGSGQRKARRERSRGEGDDELVDDMGEMGTAGGLLGGGFEGLFVGRFALRRAKIARKRERESEEHPSDDG